MLLYTIHEIIRNESLNLNKLSLKLYIVTPSSRHCFFFPFVELRKKRTIKSVDRCSNFGRCFRWSILQKREKEVTLRL